MGWDESLGMSCLDGRWILSGGVERGEGLKGVGGLKECRGRGIVFLEGGGWLGWDGWDRRG